MCGRGLENFKMDEGMTESKNQIEAESKNQIEAKTKPFEIRITRLSVLPPGEPIFSEQCMNISIVDEGAGEYLEIDQQLDSPDVKEQTIFLSPEEWPVLKSAIEQMLEEIKQREQK